MPADQVTGVARVSRESPLRSQCPLSSRAPQDQVFRDRPRPPPLQSVQHLGYLEDRSITEMNGILEDEAQHGDVQGPRDPVATSVLAELPAARVVREAVRLDNQQALDEEVDPADAQEDDLGLGAQTRTDQRKAEERLGQGLAPSIHRPEHLVCLLYTSPSPR